jgi:2-C-methyl-D-erythritol 4-phosphate cytidylyltransferase
LSDTFTVIVAAAGKSARMGAGALVNKPYIRVKGKPLLAYSLGFFDAVTWVDSVIVMVAEHETQYCLETVVNRYRYHKVRAVLPGGVSRQDSVWRGLKHLAADPPSYVAVHDAVRPFLSYAAFYQLSLEAHHYGGAVPGVKVKDTVKLADQKNFVLQTPPRDYLFSAQTPQVFHFDRLYDAYRRAEQEGYAGTDDASLYERFIGPVRLVESDVDNVKLTTPAELVLMEYMMENWKPR